MTFCGSCRRPQRDARRWRPSSTPFGRRTRPSYPLPTPPMHLPHCTGGPWRTRSALAHVALLPRGCGVGARRSPVDAGRRGSGSDGAAGWRLRPSVVSRCVADYAENSAALGRCASRDRSRVERVWSSRPNVVCRAPDCGRGAPRRFGMRASAWVTALRAISPISRKR